MGTDPKALTRTISQEQLLAEVEETIRTRPTNRELMDPQTVAWPARAAVVIQQWDFTLSPTVQTALSHFVRAMVGTGIASPGPGIRQIDLLLHQARTELSMELGRSGVVLTAGQPFEYFDEVRKRVEMARTEVFFVDPYLNAEFVSRYLPQIVDGVKVRLLGGKNLDGLIAAVKAYRLQHPLEIEVRSHSQFHDRYYFIDRATGYQSGASFKDGAKKTPTALIEVTDAFQAIWQLYETIWTEAKQELPPAAGSRG